MDERKCSHLRVRDVGLEQVFKCTTKRRATTEQHLQDRI